MVGEIAQAQKDLSPTELEALKERYSYRKFIWGSVFTAIVVATLPPLFQLASAVLEYSKGQAELNINREAAYQNYVKSFMDKAIDQDIELRIRLAHYFANVLEGQYKIDWQVYEDSLQQDRKAAKTFINENERDLYELMEEKEDNLAEIRELERNLEWAYREVGYAERDRSVVDSPRDAAPAGTGIAKSWIEQNIVAVKVPDLFGIKNFPASGEIRLHRFAVKPFTEAIAEIKSAGLLKKIREWNGSYADRNLIGRRGISLHALGLAFDINASYAPGMGLRRLDAVGGVEDLVAIFQRHGFKWGGENDPIHFELVEASSGEILPKPGDVELSAAK